VVEDDLDIRQSIIELLEDSGYQVKSAANGLEAISVLQSGFSPGLILLDLMMPVMDGFAFRSEQKKDGRWESIPVVVMSADGNIVEKQARAEAAAYLKKPVDIDDLLDVVGAQIAVV
jgi:CheY-like chemotaxis protein